jgi:hypothetical protein
MQNSDNAMLLNWLYSMQEVESTASKREVDRLIWILDLLVAMELSKIFFAPEDARRTLRTAGTVILKVQYLLWKLNSRESKNELPFCEAQGKEKL